METIFDQLMNSYDQIRKRQYSLVEQEAKPAAGKGSDAQALSRRYNRIIGGTKNLDDSQSNQIKADLLACPSESWLTWFFKYSTAPANVKELIPAAVPPTLNLISLPPPFLKTTLGVAPAF